MSIPFRLLIPRNLYDRMVSQALQELPNECCGLLAGPPVRNDAQSTVVPDCRAVACFPLVNAAASPVEYLSDPKSMFDACRQMRSKGLDILAVYHSHPTSSPVPSRTDLERNYSPQVMNLIISLEANRVRMEAWWLSENGYKPGEWTLAADETDF